MTTASAPLISVILPTHNRAHLLGRAVRSVLAQDYSKLEVIIVDDASSDETQQLAGTISDPRVRYIRRHAQGGAGAARNTGIAAATGTLVAFQDSDDEWLADKLTRQLAILDAAGPGVAMVCGTYVARFRDGREITVAPEADGRRGEFETELLSGFRFITPTWLVRRDALERAGGFDERLPNREDWELVFRIIEQGAIRAELAPIVIKHVTAGSVESNPRARIDSYRAVMQRHQARWAKRPWLQAVHYFNMARAHIELNEPGAARQALHQAIRLRPLWPLPYLLWLSLAAGIGNFNRLQSMRARWRSATARGSSP